MAVSKKLRFEVFKRDNFTCQYCGRQTPNVILEIDHIVPTSQAGDDDIQNLITSCFECNRGKAGTPLTVIKTRADLADDLVKLAEKELQLREYKKLQNQIRRREDRDITQIEESFQSWCKRRVLTQYGQESFRRFLKIFPVDKVIEAINASAIKVGSNDPEQMIDYTFGILHHWRRDQNLLW